MPRPKIHHPRKPMSPGLFLTLLVIASIEVALIAYLVAVIQWAPR